MTPQRPFDKLAVVPSNVERRRIGRQFTRGVAPTRLLRFGEPNVRELEPDGRLAPTARWPPRDCVTAT
ncbi:MAG: hypothetical protein A3G76_14315 [Acidobacteria bacterium RIFCSPLOWO2_12_FULL_65_11]|nr:MAG: hypothetical protein A3G76_14315 [Acidobacteria bacterium RIFCSPLOWO2_12_FULL_65_11]